MSKHSLISTVAGLGLMAASLGASAQLHTFDYSSMYYGSTASGAKYVAFVPTLNRDSATSNGAAGVLMLDLFQPATGSASTWAYAIGGAVIPDAGQGATNTNVSSAAQVVSWTANNGLAISQNFFFGNNEEIKLAFSQAVAATGTPAMNCNVTFSAVASTNDQLFFKSVVVAPDNTDWKTASAALSVSTNSATTAGSYTIAQTAWNEFSVTMTLPAGASAAVSGLDGGSIAGTKVAATGALRNRCVPAYNARATGGGVTPIVGSGIGLVRLW